MFPLFAIVVVVVGGPGDLLTDIVRAVVVGEEVGVVVVGTVVVGVVDVVGTVVVVVGGVVDGSVVLGGVVCCEVVVLWLVVVVSGVAVDLDVCSAIFQQNIVLKIEMLFA